MPNANALCPPSSDFSQACISGDSLISITVDGWVRITLAKYPDPLGCRRDAPSRFSSPRGEYAVLYLASAVRGAFLEAILRDGPKRISQASLEPRIIVAVGHRDEVGLQVLDLRGDAASVLGIPTDVQKAASHGMAQGFSRWLHDAIPECDGILFESRYDSALTNLALFERSFHKLHPTDTCPVLESYDLWDFVTRYSVELF